MARLSSHGDDSPSPFLAALRAVIVQWPAAEAAPRFLVAFSGGVDSTVLLAALVGLGARVRAAHVDHGLHADSSDWSARCAAVAADLGLDKLLVYRLDAAAGTIQPNDPPSTSIRPGSGPRHFAFHPNGRFAYVINEIVCTMTALAYDAQRGVLTEIETVSTLPAGEAMKPEFSTAEVVVHPSGRTVYGSNRGHHTIAVFRCDPATGRLTLVQNQSTGGKTPRNFAVDPTGRWLFAENQDSDSVVQFAIDQASGKLKPTGKSLLVGAPVCIRFVAL